MAGSEQAKREPEAFLARASDDRDVHGPEDYGNGGPRTLLGSAAVETAIWVIELGVGLACLVLGLSALRTTRFWPVGIVLLIAGAAASGHALIQVSGG
jgi:hypothetical protein